MGFVAGSHLGCGRPGPFRLLEDQLTCRGDAVGFDLAGQNDEPVPVQGESGTANSRKIWWIESSAKMPGWCPLIGQSVADAHTSSGPFSGNGLL